MGEQFPLPDLAACAEREVRKRRHVYPNRILTGRMSQRFADRQIAMMEAIGEILRALSKLSHERSETNEHDRQQDFFGC